MNVRQRLTDVCLAMGWVWFLYREDGRARLWVGEVRRQGETQRLSRQEIRDRLREHLDREEGA